MEYLTLMNNMKKIREDQKLSLSVIARATGIPVARLREAEKGDERLTVGELDKLLAFYQMSASDVLKYRRSQRGIWLGTAVAGLILLLIAFGMGLGDRLEGLLFQESRQAASGNAAIGGDEAAAGGGDSVQPGSAQPADEAAGGAGSPGGSSGASAGDSASNEAGDADDDSGDGEIGTDAGGESEASGLAADPMMPAGDGTQQGEAAGGEVILRFWGNIAYDADGLPELPDNGDERIFHIIPVEQLSTDRPAWLDKVGQGRYLLNLGNADIWTKTTVAEWQRLTRDGFNVIGLGRQLDVYKPYVMEIEGRKIGILSLSGLIHEADQIATSQRIGLPRAYDEQEIRNAVSSAREQVDYLFVLPHVGNKRGTEEPINRQRRLARLIAEAGGDFIIGNRSIRTQQAEVINGVPVFYSLGRSVSADAKDGLLNYVVDVHLSDTLDKVVIHLGEMEGGTLRFDRDLTSHRATIEQQLDQLNEAIGQLEIQYRHTGISSSIP